MGGPAGLLIVGLAQVVVAGFFVIDPRICFALVLGVGVLLFVLERPLIGVGVLIGARLLSTGAIVFLRIGTIGIGPFEPALLLCLFALLAHALSRRTALWQRWPWQAPWLALAGWIVLSLAWCVDKKDAIGDILPMLMVLANTIVILAYVKTWADFQRMLWFWVGACVLIGLLTIAVDVLGIQVTTVTFKAASGGGRETGLGQQPNWFAMNLMFIIHTCFGMALVDKVRWRRWLLVLAGCFIFFMMLLSGSRGGAAATLIGGLLAAGMHPLFRRWFLRFGAITAVIFVVGISFNLGDSAKALMRIASNLGLSGNYRELNWLVCVQMFLDTKGLGIGAGGYELLLPSYNYYVSDSLYDYPHGIFWEVIAHYGVVGLVLCAWLFVAVVRMVREVVALTKGTVAGVYAWTMPAAMLGYFAWSFLEFTLNEKPFWEWLALYTALYFIARKARADGVALPAYSTEAAPPSRLALPRGGAR